MDFEYELSAGQTIKKQDNIVVKSGNNIELNEYNYKYAFTGLYRFQERLNELDELLDKESHIKITKQYELFDNMYKKTVKIYGIKHRLDLRYIRDRLIKLNKTNPDFTIIPIKIEVNQAKNDAIHASLLPHMCLLHKVMCAVSKHETQSYLFNKTCFDLKWFC
jgi:hypothetical protein